VSNLVPYPTDEVAAFLSAVDEAVVVEMNATAQFRGLTQRELGRFGSKLSSMLKYDGEPFEPGEIAESFLATTAAGTQPEPADNVRLARGD
jgi:hypothetical protein